MANTTSTLESTISRGPRLKPRVMKERLGSPYSLVTSARWSRTDRKAKGIYIAKLDCGHHSFMHRTNNVTKGSYCMMCQAPAWETDKRPLWERAMETRCCKTST